MDDDDARERLQAEQTRVEGLVEELKAELGTAESEDELADYDQHPADTASDTFEREKDLSILEQLEHEARGIAGGARTRRMPAPTASTR